MAEERLLVDLRRRCRGFSSCACTVSKGGIAIGTYLAVAAKIHLENLLVVIKAEYPERVEDVVAVDCLAPVSYTHLTLPTTPYV